MALLAFHKLTAGLARTWAGYLRDWDRSLRAGNYPETTRYNYLLAAAQRGDGRRVGWTGANAGNRRDRRDGRHREDGLRRACRTPSGRPVPGRATVCGSAGSRTRPDAVGPLRRIGDPPAERRGRVRQIPTGLEAKAGLWRERTADKQVLLVLDDAADNAHVIPLLPAAPGCLVLITSRRKLATLPGVTMLPLDTLPAADAMRLFVDLAGSGSRQEEAAVRRIAHLCGHLPLAITMTAARLRIHRTWSVADLVEDLEQARDRLDGIATGELAVAAAFDLSCRDLSVDRQRLFRRLALHPGPELDVYTAAALDHSDVAAARHGLEELLEHNLLTEPQRGRFRFHDLIAVHARAQAEVDPKCERDAALDRLLSYYLRAAGEAAAGLRAGFDSAGPQLRSTEIPSVADPRRAADWFTVELPGLIAAVMAAVARRHPAAFGVPAALHEHLRHCGPFALAIRLHQTALTATRHVGDRAAEARTLVNLAHMRQMTSDFPGALASAEQAHTLFLSIGDVAGQGDAMDAVARIWHVTGDYPAAAGAADRAHALHCEAGNRRGQAAALEILARIRAGLGDFSGASATAERAHALYGELDEPRGQAHTLLTLALVRYVTGACEAAGRDAERARAFYERVADGMGQATAMDIQARVWVAAGDWHAAAVTAGRARAVQHRLGDRIGEANALETVARAQYAIGDYRAAADAAGQARSLYERADAVHGQANAVQILGIVHHAAGDHPARWPPSTRLSPDSAT